MVAENQVDPWTEQDDDALAQLIIEELTPWQRQLLLALVPLPPAPSIDSPCSQA